MNKFISLTVTAAFMFCLSVCSDAAEVVEGKITGDGVNVRIDSTVLSDIIGQVNKDSKVEILKHKYEWYKIQLPDSFSCFVYKKFFTRENSRVYRCEADNVNVRMGPSLDTHILGKIKNGQEVVFKSFVGDFIEIAPPEGIGGWVHQKFVSIDDVTQVKSRRRNFISRTEADIEKSKKEEVSSFIADKGSITGTLRNFGGDFLLYSQDGRWFRIVTRRKLESFVDKKVEITFQKQEKDRMVMLAINDIREVE